MSRFETRRHWAALFLAAGLVASTPSTAMELPAGKCAALQFEGERVSGLGRPGGRHRPRRGDRCPRQLRRRLLDLRRPEHRHRRRSPRCLRPSLRCRRHADRQRVPDQHCRGGRATLAERLDGARWALRRRLAQRSGVRTAVRSRTDLPGERGGNRTGLRRSARLPIEIASEVAGRGRDGAERSVPGRLGGFLVGRKRRLADSIQARRFAFNGTPSGSAVPGQHDHRVDSAPAVGGRWVRTAPTGSPGKASARPAMTAAARASRCGATVSEVRRLSGEMQVNSFTPGGQRRPDVAVSPLGNALVVFRVRWFPGQRPGRSLGAGPGLRLRRFTDRPPVPGQPAHARQSVRAGWSPQVSAATSWSPGPAKIRSRYRVRIAASMHATSRHPVASSTSSFASTRAGRTTRRGPRSPPRLSERWWSGTPTRSAPSLEFTTHGPEV